MERHIELRKGGGTHPQGLNQELDPNLGLEATGWSKPLSGNCLVCSQPMHAERVTELPCLLEDEHLFLCSPCLRSAHSVRRMRGHVDLHALRSAHGEVEAAIVQEGRPQKDLILACWNLSWGPPPDPEITSDCEIEKLWFSVRVLARYDEIMDGIAGAGTSIILGIV